MASILPVLIAVLPYLNQKNRNIFTFALFFDAKDKGNLWNAWNPIAQAIFICYQSFTGPRYWIPKFYSYGVERA